MDEIIAWEQWCALTGRHYPSGKRGRPRVGTHKMPRMYLLQCRFGRSDEGLSVRDPRQHRHAGLHGVDSGGVDFGQSRVPDAITLLKFRHLLEDHALASAFFNRVTHHLERAGVMMRGG